MTGQLEEELREEDSDFVNEIHDKNEAHQALGNVPNRLNNLYPEQG